MNKKYLIGICVLVLSVIVIMMCCGKQAGHKEDQQGQQTEEDSEQKNENAMPEESEELPKQGEKEPLKQEDNDKQDGLEIKKEPVEQEETIDYGASDGQDGEGNNRNEEESETELNPEISSELEDAQWGPPL